MSALTGEEDIIPTVAPAEPVDVVNGAAIPMVLSDDLGAPSDGISPQNGPYQSGVIDPGGEENP